MGEDLSGGDGYVSEEDAVRNMTAGRKLVDDLVDVLHEAGRHTDIRRVHVLLATMPRVIEEFAQAKMLAAVAIAMLAEEREQAGPRLALGKGK